MQTDLGFYEEEILLEEGLEKNRELGKTIRDVSYRQTMNDDNTDIQRGVVHKVIMGHPEGITDLELCIFTGFSRSSICARRNELDDVVAVGYAKIMYDCGDRLNTLWGIL